MNTATRHRTVLPPIELKRKATKDIPLYVIDAIQATYDQARRAAESLVPTDELVNTYDDILIDNVDDAVRHELHGSYDTIVGHIDAINESASEDDTSAIDDIVEMEYALRRTINAIS